MNLKKKYKMAVACVTAIFFSACAQQPKQAEQANIQAATPTKVTKMDNSQLDTITLGAGCFWCVEAVFQQLKGVEKVTSGYSGGTVKNPSYREVCAGTTGHAEVAQIVYDPKVVSLPEILEVFWKTHDPTTLNRQGHDVGTQYRSAIFYRNEEQRQIAEEYKKKVDESHAYDAPLVTEIKPLINFYPAEDYHQNYFNQNGDQPYCQYVIQPKVDKFKAVFKDKVK